MTWLEFETIFFADDGHVQLVCKSSCEFVYVSKFEVHIPLSIRNFPFFHFSQPKYGVTILKSKIYQNQDQNIEPFTDKNEQKPQYFVGLWGPSIPP